jgi:FAD/FMN-containing dehydrogenase
MWNGHLLIAQGTCPGVGIGGHFTHGGYSYTSRHCGPAIDQIIALDVVLANSIYVKATSTDYPEIFWAMRGAAENFSIVTEFYLQTYLAPLSVVRFKYEFEGMLDLKNKFWDTFLHL